MAVAVVFVAVITLLTNVPTGVTEDDAAVFRTVLAGQARGEGLDYPGQIALIERVQRRLLALVPVGDAIPDEQSREPRDLFKKHSGFCYDRSRTLDKAFAWLGFETRHVYILYPETPATGEPLPIWRSLVTPRSPSHSVTEVKTRRGWLLVDSLEPWIGVTGAGEPVDAVQVPARLGDFRYVPTYFHKKYLAIRGLYSRRGHLYPPYVPLPDINWIDFAKGLI